MEKLQTSCDPKVKAEFDKGAIMFCMDNLVQSAGNMTDTDLLLVARGDKYEVWTQREFKAKTLILVPESTELKPRFFTQNRSVICKNTNDLTCSDKRPFVIDGRVRGNPTEDSKTSFCLFWLVARTSMNKQVNLSLKYSTAVVDATLTVGDVSMKPHWGKDDLPSIPCLINESEIPKTLSSLRPKI